MTAIRELISAWTMVLIGSLLLPLVSFAAISGTTCDVADTTTTAPATIAEHTAAVETVIGGEISLRSMASVKLRYIFGLSRISNAPKNTFAPGEVMPNGRVAGMGPGAALNSEQARALAQQMKFKPVKGAPFRSHGQPVFKKGTKYITPDVLYTVGGGAFVGGVGKATGVSIKIAAAAQTYHKTATAVRTPCVVLGAGATVYMLPLKF